MNLLVEVYLHAAWKKDIPQKTPEFRKEWHGE
jgi:hypothetical protein